MCVDDGRFDPHFNAITGLNGSGKSNILDSICFVLGISNLSQVRAGNLHELVYKQGQAGVNRAVVTINFDNSDPTGSPVGYESSTEISVTRQVLIGGKSKYLINGHTAQAGQVQNLFHSVQLNVNNPHFLIMQGRITKVLNMKPHEILGMVEEAAGTRMYETKKLAAQKTIEKKEQKVVELNSVLKEEINPTLEKLRGEKQHYLKWSKNNADIERIERFCIAYDYSEACKTLSASKGEVTEMRTKISTFEAEARSKDKEASALDESICALKEQLSGDIDAEHTAAKAEEEALSKELVKAQSILASAQKNVDAAEGDINKAEASVTAAKAAVGEKRAAIIQDEKNCDALKQAAVDASASYAQLQETYQNMAAGISTSADSSSASLPEQIAAAGAAANDAAAKIEQSSMKIEHLGKSVVKLQGEMKKEEANAKKLNEKKAACLKNVNNISVAIDELGFSEQHETELYERKTQLERTYSNIRENAETLSAQLAGRLSFNYSDPRAGFDRSKVKGLVAKLVSVAQPKHATALEVVAGGKLYQVVVDDAATGKEILARGKLQRRVTIIPLDKVQSRGVSSDAKAMASSLASRMGTTSAPAIELVGYDADVKKAVEYVFGSSLVVDGMEAANKICDATRTRTVTLQGDVFDPSGTISGGSNKNLGTTLQRLTDLALAKKELKSIEVELRAVRKEYESLKDASTRFGELSDKLELAKAQFAQAEKHLGQTKYGMLEQKYLEISEEVEEAKEVMEKMVVEKEEKQKLYEELKGREAELTKAREDRLKGIQDEIAKAKVNAEETAAAATKVGNSAETLRLELESLEKEVADLDASVELSKKASLKALDEKVAAEDKVSEQQAMYDEAKENLAEVEEQIQEVTSEIKKVSDEKKLLKEAGEKAMLEAKKLSVSVKRFTQERGNAERFVNATKKKHSWIETEQEQFGVAGGDYDFEAQDPVKTGEKLKKLRSEQVNLSKKINKKVMGMIEKAEGEYADLLRKKKVIENDKKKIQSVIEELDEKKKSELERTWKKVNTDFGSIFSTLLPGTMAKLEPPEGQKAWEGLEVKVAFNNVWKQSLTELSGGQRSLLALSLILSMLLFKPAPMYILDEVDAALDLSHTQNIGAMLKTHFKHSQFIVVSLKEGMFNNANTIFRTKFVDGCSTVSRTIGIGASDKAREMAEKNVDGQPSKKRQATGRSRKGAATGGVN